MPQFQNERSTTIAAPAAVVYAHLIDFRRWIDWSPWEGLDPELQRTYSDPSAGVGAEYQWSGNRKAGEGRMTISEATEPTDLSIRLEFLKPFQATNQAIFTLAEADGTTTARWRMEGERPLLMAILGRLFFDKAIAKDFDRGLAALKAVSEAEVG